jgi:hypothetical protein
MEDINKKVTNTDLIEWEKEFKRIMLLAYEIFGKHAFRKMSSDGKRRPINKAVYEIWVKNLHELGGKDGDILTQHKNQVQSLFVELCKDPSFQISLKSSDKTVYTTRMNSIKTLIEGVIHG